MLDRDTYINSRQEKGNKHGDKKNKNIRKQKVVISW